MRRIDEQTARRLVFDVTVTSTLPDSRCNRAIVFAFRWFARMARPSKGVIFCSDNVTLAQTAARCICVWICLIVRSFMTALTLASA